MNPYLDDVMTRMWILVIALGLFTAVLFGIGFASIHRPLPVSDLEASHPNWSHETCITIHDGRVSIGMTQEMVLASRGRPSNINKTVGSWGIHEQWVYGSSIKYRTYLYFENGYLTSWQE